MTQRTERIRMLEYLRGIASLSVAWFHMTNSFTDSWVAWSGSGGWLGVESFFVISGFVIPYALWTSYPRYSLRDMPHFLGRRVLRIEPPYLISILMVLVLGWLSSMAPGFQGQSQAFEPGQVAAHLLYLVPLTQFSWLQPVYWTLAYEFVFYITIACLFPSLSGPGRFHVYAAVATALATMVALGLASTLLLLFVMGVGVYRCLTGQDHHLKTLVILAACGLIMAVENAPAQAAVGFVTAVFILYHGRLSQYLRIFAAPLAWLGAISYSLYLVHVPIGGRVVNIGKRFVHDDVGYMCVALVALVFSLVAAYVFYRLIEVPSMQLAQKLLPSQPKSAQLGPV
ncbi:acyltransferase [Aquidulcibacter sp.]|uniref:acyltransferase family protein n=1 Tax=Aquidulcibacter sp. TaxID=2052990 RepID=UPI0025BB314C|nr:acyltransferase [Aquidulcibacter sp.]MCA3693466.1 acyltransferase [Aquidulcibacter sp.]